MITPHLEELICMGAAQYKTYTHGGGPVGTIQIPEGCYIIITDFIWTPFLDLEVLGKDWLTEIIYRNTKQLQLRSEGQNVSYIFRDNIVCTFDPGGAVNSISCGEPRQIHCYYKFINDVYLDIGVVYPNNLWVDIDFSAVGTVAAEPDLPNGFGVGTSVLKSFRAGAGNSTVNILGQKRNPMSQTPADRNVQEFHSDYDGFNNLSNPGFALVNAGNFCYPLITFGYVEVRKTNKN